MAQMLCSPLAPISAYAAIASGTKAPIGSKPKTWRKSQSYSTGWAWLAANAKPGKCKITRKGKSK